MLSRLVITFLPRSKRLLILWQQSPSAVILEPKKIKSVIVSIVFPSICHEVMGLDATILVFWILSRKPAFSLSSFTLIKTLSSSSLLSAIRVVLSAYLRWLIFLLAGLIPAYKTPVTNLAMFNSYINSFHSEVPGVEVAAHGNRFSTTSGTYWMRNSMGGTQEFISSPDDADAGSNQDCWEKYQ